MGDTAVVGELRYRIVIENYEDVRKKLADLGGVSGGGAANSASGQRSTSSLGGGGEAISRSGGANISTGTPGRSRSTTGGRSTWTMLNSSDVVQSLEGEVPEYLSGLNSRSGIGSGGSGGGPRAGGPRFRGSFSGANAAVGFSGSNSAALAVGAGFAYAAFEVDSTQTRLSTAMASANTAKTQRGYVSSVYDAAEAPFQAGIIGRILGTVANNFDIGIDGPRSLAKQRIDDLALLDSRNSLASSTISAGAARRRYEAGSARNPTSAYVRDVISINEQYNQTRTTAGREMGSLRRRIAKGIGDEVENEIALNNYRDYKNQYDSAGSVRDDALREASNNYFAGRDMRRASSAYDRGTGEALQTAAGGLRYSGAQDQLIAQQKYELASYYAQNSTFTAGGVQILNKSAENGLDSMLLRQRGERDLVAADRKYAVGGIDLSQDTTELGLQARRNRDVYGAKATAETGSVLAEIRGLVHEQMNPQAIKAGQLGIESLNLTKRDYLEGFRGVQTDLRNINIDNPRDIENPATTLKTISDSIGRIEKAISDLVSN